MVLNRILQLLRWRMEQVDLLWWLLLAAALVIEIVVLMRNKGSKRFHTILSGLIFCIYLLLVLTATVFSRETISADYDLLSFDISTAWTRGPGIYGPIDTATELAMNVLVFAPFGFLLMRLSKKTWVALGASFLITLAIETLQLITRRGFFELADILLNFAGAVIGWLVYGLLRKRRGKPK